jgi:hypothetical protein
VNLGLGSSGANPKRQTKPNVRNTADKNARAARTRFVSSRTEGLGDGLSRHLWLLRSERRSVPKRRVELLRLIAIGLKFPARRASRKGKQHTPFPDRAGKRKFSFREHALSVAYGLHRRTCVTEVSQEFLNRRKRRKQRQRLFFATTCLRVRRFP